jgi:hypothetical protein
MAQNTRGKLYVDRDVQRALLWQLFRHWTIFIVVLVAMLLALEALAGGPPRSLSDYAGVLWARHAPLLIVIASLFPVFAYDSIKLSHRFVGPIVRLRGALKAAAAGQPVKPVQFRENDFWHDMADSFNDLMQQVAEERKGQARSPTETWDVRSPASLNGPLQQDELQEV